MKLQERAKRGFAEQLAMFSPGNLLGGFPKPWS